MRLHQLSKNNQAFPILQSGYDLPGNVAFMLPLAQSQQGGGGLQLTHKYE